MSSRILLDENKQYWFDFSNIESVWEIHEITNKITLSDVDFIAKTDKEILFIEYKNANIIGASKPNQLNEDLKGDKKINQLVKKYYDSLLVFWAFHNKNELPIRYIFIVEGPLIDVDFRKRIKYNLMNRLPFKLENKEDTKKFISAVEVYDLQEFRNNIPEIKITPVVQSEDIQLGGNFRLLPCNIKKNEEITKIIDLMIVNNYLDIDYNVRLPMIIFSEKGWETYLDKNRKQQEYWIYKIFNKVGDVLIINGENITYDEEETNARRERIRKLMDSLWEQ